MSTYMALHRWRAWLQHLTRAARDSFAPLPWLAFLSLCLSIEDPNALICNPTIGDRRHETP